MKTDQVENEQEVVEILVMTENLSLVKVHNNNMMRMHFLTISLFPILQKFPSKPQISIHTGGDFLEKLVDQNIFW